MTTDNTLSRSRVRSERDLYNHAKDCFIHCMIQLWTRKCPKGESATGGFYNHPLRRLHDHTSGTLIYLSFCLDKWWEEVIFCRHRAWLWIRFASHGTVHSWTLVTTGPGCDHVTCYLGLVISVNVSVSVSNLYTILGFSMHLNNEKNHSYFLQLKWKVNRRSSKFQYLVFILKGLWMVKMHSHCIVDS